jgi:hypothetical protein
VAQLFNGNFMQVFYIDESGCADAVAGHHGFTPKELDFILNYDIKYRLGRNTESEGE